MKKIFTTLLSISFISVMAQVPAPAPDQKEKITIEGATIHIGNGQVIENGHIVFEKGRIIAVGSGKSADRTGKIIAADGSHVYPGIIMPNSTLGLTEIGALRPTHDYAETGLYNANSRAIIAYNAESELTPTLRTNGVLIAQISPLGGYVSGTSSLVQLDAWNWEDAAIKKDEGLAVTWPNMYQRSGWWAEPGGVKKADKRDETIRDIKKFYEEAKSYNETVGTKELNLQYRAMRGLFSGDLALYLRVNGAQEIIESVGYFKELGIKRIVVVGGKDAWLAADFLKTHNVPVILQVIHDLPSNQDDNYDLVYKTPFLLKQAGIEFCLAIEGEQELMRARNLPFLAGTAVSYGLEKEEALKTITLSAAKILAIDKDFGSLEKGKSATLFISKGDALDMMTNDLTHAFINGREISLDGKQKRLYEKYMEKYGK